jgi:hypothetical protein
MSDEGLDQFAAGPAEGLRAAKVRGVRFDESWIKVVLSDQQAELIPQSGLTIVRGISVVLLIFMRWFRRGFRRSGRATQFLDRAHSNAVSLTKGPVNGPRFGYAHLGTADERRYI